ncbi:myogenic factor 6-like [Corticium candelabrum]|uniref:myogenic factor 6-like n=1 Tax=Corticium candelabrum TaxID=121492 RepID=UPI002E25B341|nr:myogenic factor 6-like [Corticium candelabrum]
MSSGSDVGVDLAELDTQARTKARRKRAALREQRRSQELNKAFDELQKCLPFIPVRSRVSKKTVLELAIEYIRQMQDQLLDDSANGRGKLNVGSSGDDVIEMLCASDCSPQGSQSAVDANAASSSRDLLCHQQLGVCHMCGCDAVEHCMSPVIGVCASFNS